MRPKPTQFIGILLATILLLIVLVCAGATAFSWKLNNLCTPAGLNLQVSASTRDALGFEPMTTDNATQLRWIFEIESALLPATSTDGGTLVVINRPYGSQCSNLYIYQSANAAIQPILLQNAHNESIFNYWLSLYGDYVIARIVRHDENDHVFYRVWSTTTGQRIGDYAFAEFETDTAEQTRLLIQTQPGSSDALLDLGSHVISATNPDRRLPEQIILSGNRQRYATLANDLHTVDVWSRATRQRLATLVHTQSLISQNHREFAQFSQSGEKLLTRDNQGQWLVWNIETQRLESTLETTISENVVFSPDFTYVAVSNRNYDRGEIVEINLFEVATQRRLHHFEVEDGDVLFSPDETVFVVSNIPVVYRPGIVGHRLFSVASSELLQDMPFVATGSAFITADGRFLIYSDIRWGGSTTVYAVPAQQ